MGQRIRVVMKKYKILMVVLLLIGAGIYVGWPVSPEHGVSLTAASALPSAPQEVIGAKPEPLAAVTVSQQRLLQPFKDWVTTLKTTPAPTVAFIEEGIRLAQARKTEMQSLVRTNPERALANAVSLREYAALPDAIKPYVEKPFSERASIMILPDESGLNSQRKPRFDPNQRIAGEVTTLTLAGSTASLDLVRYGSRAEVLSKDGIAAQGIMLDGVAAIQPAALQLVDTQDIAYVQKTFPARTADKQHDFLTGEAIQGQPTVALAGGQVFYFASAANVERLNLKLAELEKQIGPQTGSQILFQPLQSQSLATTVPFNTQLNQALAALNTWTENPKSVYYIRVDFSDKPGEPITKAALETALGASSDSLKSMSQNKTWLNYTVSDVVVRLPLTTTEYKTQGAGKLHDDAKAAFTALNTGITLANYNIVGVYMTSIGMGGWAGLASVGGGSQWLQGSSHRFVLDHEFGHNYGLLHAHSWNTTDGSVTGVGESEDYGDIYDAMGASYDLRATFHPQGRSKLNWLESSQWQDVSTSNNYRIYRFDDTSASGNRALRINRGGTNGHYWVGHRQNFDTNAYMENGLYLIWQRNNTTDGWLLDTTPNSSDGKNDAPIVLGKTYSDTTAGIHITPVAKGGTTPNEYMDVQVNLGAFSNNTPPVLSGINGTTNVKARTATNFSAQVSDADNDTLAYHWDFGDGVVNVNAAAISHQWAVGGTYTVKLTVSDMKGGVATTQATVNVEDPLNVWFSRTSGSTESLSDITTDGTKVIAVGNGGNILTSLDGVTWSMVDSGSNLRWYGIHYANSLWVVVGDDYRWGNINGRVGVVYTSSDGVTWTKRHETSTASTSFSKVTYGNSVWVAVGDNGTIASSTDAVTWMAQSGGTTNSIRGVAFGDGFFVATAGYWQGSPNLVLRSTDGVSWSNVSSGAGTTSSMWSVRYLHDRFVATGWYAGIRHSTDSALTFQGNQPSAYATPALSYGNGLFFASGLNRSNSNADINLVSTDGSNWTLLTTVSQPNRNAAIFFKNTFITVGDDGSIYQSSPLNVDTIPLPFTFAVKTNTALSTLIVSDPVQITDIDATTPWAVDNGEACVSSTNSCSCDVSGFATSGTVVNNQYLCVRHTASNTYAGNVSSTLTVGGVSASFGSTTIKSNQTITFGSLDDKTLGSADFVISATASSNLAVTFSSQTPTVCSVAGTSVHLIATGTCTIRASQAGNATYNAATPVDRSFTVNASTSTVDSDGDGVSDAVDQSPNNPNVATPNDQQGNMVKLETAHAFQNVAIVPASTLPTTGKPDASSYDFPKGAIEYTVTGIPIGGQITVTITFANAIPSGSQVYKVSNSGGYQLFPNAVINGNQVTLTLTDGGLGDDDGTANGVIVDPVAIAEPVNTTSTGSSGGGGGGGSLPVELCLFGVILLLVRHRACDR